ncbi:MAG: hypothetical protein ABSH09_35705, partial [Bryobacteraceae bacterium]
GGYDVTFRGARPLANDVWDRYRRTTINDIFYILRERLHEPGLIFESRGADVWENAPVEIVDITDAQNNVVTVYFHKTTKVPIREVMVWHEELTKDRNEQVTLYTKFREVDGVQWPQTVQRNRNGEKVYEMFAETLEINKKLPDAIFDLPAGVKKLKPE